MSGADTLADHAVLDFVDVHAHADRAILLLQQAEYRAIGVRVDIDEVENSVVGQRVGTGHYDTAILSRANDPSPSSGIAQSWTRAGFGGSNFGRYYNPEFERLVDRAETAPTRDHARSLWRAAMETV